ncbi:DUF4369 domain-containing protein [Pedobacter ginsengisoli]|uniref:DUF4369 domain-containing protein n=1 Tax=Pedobacter ginsengisoli TaxID=363852 RepID=UPI002550DF7B|nr:DUF4369 domain-containing protein [Pedobacter ginsengisoli]
MKKEFIILLFCLIFNCIPSDVISQTKKGFTITGHITDLKSGSKLYILIKSFGKIDTISSCIAKQNTFTFKNIQLPVHPEFYLICIKTEFVENLQLFLDQKDNVAIFGALKEWPNVKITGSNLHDDFIAAKAIRKKLMTETFATKFPAMTAPPDTILAYSRASIAAVMDQMPNSIYLPAMLATWTYTTGKFIPPIAMKKLFYERLSELQKNSHYGKILSKQIEQKLNNNF